MSMHVSENKAFFSFLEHLNFVEDDSSSYEVGVTGNGFSYLDLGSEKKIKQISFEEKQLRDTGAALDGSTRARGQSNIAKVETVEHDEICLDTDLLSIIKDIETRKNKPALFPYAVVIASVLGVIWFLLPMFLSLPFLGMLMYGVLYVPGTLVLLVNTAKLDHSRKNIQFSYRIEGLGKSAYENINNSLATLNQCGQKLLFTGKQHYEDTKYTGGAQSLPRFAQIKISRGTPPLLDLDFDVWHLRAFQQDYYFMPDHVLVFQGAHAGGISYANLNFDLGMDQLQARDFVEQTHDSTVVGKTWRFVNKDGSPDQRFNNNIEIPILEYGILRLAGSGIDLSIYASNRAASDAVPKQFDAMLEIARKPVRKLAEERRAEAVRKRKQRMEGTFQTVLEAMCCMMLADRKIVQQEIKTVVELMNRIKSPWENSEVNKRIKIVIERAKTNGFENLLRETCSKLGDIESAKQREAIIKCLDQVANSDGKLEKSEMKIKDRLVSVLNG